MSVVLWCSLLVRGGSSNSSCGRGGNYAASFLAARYGPACRSPVREDKPWWVLACGGSTVDV